MRKTETILDYKCPACGGVVKFDAEKQKFRCEWCDSVFTEADLKSYADTLAQQDKEAVQEETKEIKTEHDFKATENAEEISNMNAYACKSCGAEIICDENTSATACPYCGNTVVLTGRLIGMNKPDAIIPFKLAKEQAIAALKGFYGKRLLLPKTFKDENKLKEIKGMYVPYWLYDCDASAALHYNATRVRFFSDAKYNYTETSHYKVEREGTLSFKNIPVDGSKQMDDSYMEGMEPFNYNEMVDFNPAFLSGFLADKYDVDAKAAKPRAVQRMEKSIQEQFSQTVQGYASVVPAGGNVNTEKGVCKYALLPVWVFQSQFNKENFLFTINGQTGKVSGRLPIDKKKLRLICACAFAVITALGQFFIWG